MASRVKHTISKGKKAVRSRARRVRPYIVPSQENDHLPHLLRIRCVCAVAAVILALFGGALYLQRTITTGDTFLAAIIASVLVDLTNEDRASENLGQLRHSETLALAAQLKAADMAARGYFSHDTPEGRNPWYWFSLVGYDFLYAGENLAVNFNDSIDVERAWMNSPSHRANIMNSHFTEIGIGMAEGMYQGKPAIFVVQLFGAPRAAELQPLVRHVSPPTAEAAEQPAFTPTSPSQEVLVQDDTFIAVKSVSPQGVEERVAAAQAAQTQGTAIGNFFRKVLTSPRTTLSWLYSGLALLIFLVITLTIAIEVRRQHPLHIAYGVALLLLMVALHTYLTRAGGEVILAIL